MVWQYACAAHDRAGKRQLPLDYDGVSRFHFDLRADFVISLGSGAIAKVHGSGSGQCMGKTSLQSRRDFLEAPMCHGHIVAGEALTRTGVAQICEICELQQLFPIGGTFSQRISAFTSNSIPPTTMAKEKPDDEVKAKKERKEKKDKKRSEEDGVSKKSKKEKKQKATDAAGALAEEPEKIPAADIDTGFTNGDRDEDAAVAEIPKVKVPLEALVPFANPLADEKQTKKLLRTVQKGMFTANALWLLFLC